MRILVPGFASLMLTALAGCQPQASVPVPAAVSRYDAQITIRELMDAEVDPSADALWDAVTFNATLAGATAERPHTAEQWQALRRRALTLVESTNLIVMEGRQIAPPDTPVALGELAPRESQRRLDANRAAFIGFAQALRGVSLEALDAIDARDAQRLFDVGGKIDQACEACHLVYWYPPDASQPTGSSNKP